MGKIRRLNYEFLFGESEEINNEYPKYMTV